MKRLALDIARRYAGSEILLSYQLGEPLFRDHHEFASPVNNHILASVSLCELVCFIHRVIKPNPIDDF